MSEHPWTDRHEHPIDRMGYRNGYRVRQPTTRVGPSIPRVPQTRVGSWGNRRPNGSHPFLLPDAPVIGVRMDAGLAPSDRDRIPGLALGDGENEVSGVIGWLIQRAGGPWGVCLVVSSDHKGLEKPSREMPSGSGGNCRIHFLMNIHGHAPPPQEGIAKGGSWRSPSAPALVVCPRHSPGTPVPGRPSKRSTGHQERNPRQLLGIKSSPADGGSRRRDSGEGPPSEPFRKNILRKSKIRTQGSVRS